MIVDQLTDASGSEGRIKLTALEMRNEVVKKYREGQTVTIWIGTDDRGGSEPAAVKIIKFNPSSVLVERKGFKESFTYWDWLRMIKGAGKHKVHIPEKLKKMAAGY